MINISTRYVNSDPDSARDPRHAEARRADRLRDQEGDRQLDPLLLDGELRPDLPGAEAAPARRARALEAGAAREGQPHLLRADPERRRGAPRLAHRRRELAVRDSRR